MTVAQIASIISLLLAFNVPQSNINQVQSILTRSQSTIPVTTPLPMGTVISMDETLMPSASISGKLTYDGGGNVVGKISWESTAAHNGTLTFNKPSGKKYTRPLSPVDSGTLASGFEVANGDVGLELSAVFSTDTGPLTVTGSVPGLNWKLPAGVEGEYTLDGDTRTCYMTSAGLRCNIPSNENN